MGALGDEAFYQRPPATTVIYEYDVGIRGGPLIPSHCKVVGKLQLEGPITKECLIEAFRGRSAYKLTDFYCVTDGMAWAVVKVRRAQRPRLLVPVEEVEVLSLPHETAYVEDPSVDVTNPTAMLEAAGAGAPDARCVVVQGEFNHLSFVLRDGSEVPVRVLDVVPPYPSKVLELARRALVCTPMPVVMEERSIDLVTLAEGVGASSRLMFPCRASGLDLDRAVEYLDELPDVAEGEDVVLVGCQLSERIFRAHYGFSPPRVITMCPLELALRDSHRGWTLVKCCKEKGPFGVHDRVVAVPWSATRGDVAAALADIVEREGDGAA